MQTFAIKSPKGSPKLNSELVKEFQNIDVVLSTSGVTFRNNSRDMAIGPFPSLSELSSIQVGRYFGIPPKRVFAFVLALTRGINDYSPKSRVSVPRTEFWKGLR